MFSLKFHLNCFPITTMKQILLYFILFVIYVQHVQNILRTKPIFMTQCYKNKNKKTHFSKQLSTLLTCNTFIVKYYT